MSQRFIRCPHCGLPHDVLQAICPSTGKAASSVRPGDGPSCAKDSLAPSSVPLHASAKPALRRDLLGKTIGGRYAIRRVLGGGGMGTVFEAEHLTIGRSVAVKVLHPDQAKKKDAVQRFYREARAAGCIAHPNVCDVYDLDTLDDGSPYLVMERLVGATLANRIAEERKLPLYDLMNILVQVLSALGAAHHRGIVHRDIKPENVFLARRAGGPPLAKLLDFGVSKTIGALVGKKDDDVDLTRSGMVMGTPYYMSPEQARGDRDLDVRVDLYACGVILYEALTGHRPFVAANYGALLREVLSGRVRPVRELRPALPSGFDAILGKAMARNREDRYRTAAEFQVELQSLRDRHRYPPLGVGATSSFSPQRGRCLNELRSGPPPSTDASEVDEHPTHVWIGRLPELHVDDAAPTRLMLRPLRPDSGDDHDTIVRLRASDRLVRADRSFPLELRTRKPLHLR